jgi:hypothetical protein
MLPRAISSSEPQVEGAQPQRLEKTKNKKLIALIEHVKEISPQIEKLNAQTQNHIQYILADPSNKLLSEKSFELWDANSKKRWYKNGSIALVFYRELQSFDCTRLNLEMQNKGIGSEFEDTMKQNPKDPGVQEFLEVYQQNLEALEYKKFWGKEGMMMYFNLRQIKEYNESGCQIL